MTFLHPPSNGLRLTEGHRDLLRICPLPHHVRCYDLIHAHSTYKELTTAWTTIRLKPDRGANSTDLYQSSSTSSFGHLYPHSAVYALIRPSTSSFGRPHPYSAAHILIRLPHFHSASRVLVQPAVNHPAGQCNDKVGGQAPSLPPPSRTHRGSTRPHNQDIFNAQGAAREGILSAPIIPTTPERDLAKDITAPNFCQDYLPRARSMYPTHQSDGMR